MTYWLLTCIGVLISSIAQTLLKKGAVASLERRQILYAWLSPYSLLGYGLLFCAVLMSAYVLRFLELGVVASLTALAYPFVTLLSRWLFKERVTLRKVMGLSLICAGVLVFNLW